MANDKQNTNPNVPNMREQSGIYSGYAERGVLRPQGNVPNLRFPEFTEEWGNNTFGEIAKGFDYGMNASAKPFDGMNKYIRITDIDESSSLYRGDEIVSPDGKLEECYLVKENDILLARTGASTGKSYLYRNSDGILYFAGFLIRANIEKHNPLFVFSQLHTHKYWKWVSIMSTRSGQPGINSQEFASFPIYTTSIQEENKIANLLKLVDERINTQNKIIEDLKKLKVAITNWLIKSISDCSGVKYLENIADIYQPQTIPTSVLNDDDEYFVYGANGIIGKYHKYNHEYSQICITCRGNTCGNINFSVPKSWITGNAMVVNIDEYAHIVNKRYLYHYLSTINFTPLISGSGQPQIVRQPLGKLKIPTPSLEQQDNIANTIDNFEQKIEIENKYLQSLLAQKYYLLSNMFI